MGATLPSGLLLTRRLVDEGSRVRALVLNAGRSREVLPDGVEIVEVRLDRMSIQDACSGAGVIYNLFEPTSRRNSGMAADIASAVMLSAIQSGARVVMASYPFRHESDNSSMEQEALSAHQSGLVNVTVARFPQVFGPGVRSPLLSNVYNEVLEGNTAHWLGDLDAPRSLLFIEDAVNGLVLLGKEEKAQGKVWNVVGADPLTGREFINLAFEAVQKRGNPSVWGRGLMMTAGVFDSRARRFLEMPYDFYSGFVLDGSRFAEVFPEFAFTPSREAISRTLEAYREGVQRKVPEALT